MSLSLNAKQTALVLIDLEHGIVGRELAPYKGTDVVQTCAGLAEAFRRSRGHCSVCARDARRAGGGLPADKPMMPPDAPRPPKQASELVPEAGYREGKDILITKRQWGAFLWDAARPAAAAQGCDDDCHGGYRDELRRGGLRRAARLSMGMPWCLRRTR